MESFARTKEAFPLPAAPARMSDANANPRALDREALGAFLLYLTLSFFFFGRGLIGHFSTWYIGRGPDPPQLIWSVAWWAYAIAHRVNPFLTKVLFAPVGRQPRLDDHRGARGLGGFAAHLVDGTRGRV